MDQARWSPLVIYFKNSEEHPHPFIGEISLFPGPVSLAIADK